MFQLISFKYIKHKGENIWKKETYTLKKNETRGNSNGAKLFYMKGNTTFFSFIGERIFHFKNMSNLIHECHRNIIRAPWSYLSKCQYIIYTLYQKLCVWHSHPHDLPSNREKWRTQRWFFLILFASWSILSHNWQCRKGEEKAKLSQLRAQPRWAAGSASRGAAKAQRGLNKGQGTHAHGHRCSWVIYCAINEVFTSLNRLFESCAWIALMFCTKQKSGEFKS